MMDEFKNGCGPSNGGRSRGLKVRKGPWPPSPPPHIMSLEPTAQVAVTKLYMCKFEIKMRA